MSTKSSIPAWQRTPAADPSSPSSTQETAPNEQIETSPAPGVQDSAAGTKEELGTERSKLLEQASRFLEDPSIRDAPRDRKVTFLESKGVASEEIAELLGKEIVEDAIPDITEAGERAWSTVSASSPSLLSLHHCTDHHRHPRNSTRRHRLNHKHETSLLLSHILSSSLSRHNSLLSSPPVAYSIPHT
jgi:hypothetical protein